VLDENIHPVSPVRFRLRNYQGPLRSNLPVSRRQICSRLNADVQTLLKFSRFDSLAHRRVLIQSQWVS
jgi:hypothetical protein